jgi:hypothetical protein
VTCRIDAGELASFEHLGVLDIVADLGTRSGFLTILARPGDEGVLTASVGGLEITSGADNRMHAVAAVHQLLERAGIFISSEGADL